MPGMSGFEFLQNVRLVKPETKVILMSAFDIKGDIEFTNYSRDYAIEDFIQKPLAMKNLFRIVESHMTAK
jgi:FixJ family two-component response regulator